MACTNISEALYDLTAEASNDGNGDDNGKRWLCPVCRDREKFKITLVEQSQIVETPICTKFKQGICPYGISGKTLHKERACDFAHPKLCKNFVRNGLQGKYGCTLNKDCQFFHPLLCQNSVKYRKCYDKSCNRTHLKETKRKEPIPASQLPP